MSDGGPSFAAGRGDEKRMKLTNAMEDAVKRHLHELREVSESGVCWCPLCRADMMALSLSTLPPRYFTRRAAELEADEPMRTTIRDEVSRAVHHVERYPKHSRGAAVAAGEPVWVVNFPLEESFLAVETLFHEQKPACDCWKCRCDVVAFALNRYPARYGVEHQGKTHLLDGDRVLMRQELSSFLELALQVVSTVPRH